VSEKVIPVNGDLIIEGLGMSEEDRQLITNECDVIINCAASVSFNEPVHDAMNINYFGSLRMLNLGKECKNIKGYCHVSTCYVNANLDIEATIEEKIYNEDQEVDRVVS
tara:strand:- start:3009 stop:3335 length:327 start_codon:yes stop_codon:yes gene_type:complete